MNKLISYHKSIILLIAITYLSLFNTTNIDTNKLELFPHFDKFVHLIMYSSLSFTLLIEFYFRTQKNKFSLLLFSFGWGLLMELAQKLLTDYRGAEWQDVVANSYNFV